jgi:hypothetical protein
MIPRNFGFLSLPSWDVLSIAKFGHQFGSEWFLCASLNVSVDGNVDSSKCYYSKQVK